MIHNLIIAVTTWITHIIASLGYPGVALLMAIESAAIPLPSEVIMPFSGFLVASQHFSLFGLAFAGAIGSTIGSLATYYLGYSGGRALVIRYGHLVFLSHEDLDLAERFFNKFKISSTLVGRVLPIIRTFISIPAGIAKVPIGTFTLNAFAGSFVWSYFLAWLGFRLGQNWNHLEQYFRKFDVVIVGIIIIGLGYWIFRHFRKRSRL